MSIMLNFESQIVEIEKKIQELALSSFDNNCHDCEISKLKSKLDKALRTVYQKLTPWQKVQVARHPERPKFNDYLSNIFTDFIELSGDRVFADDPSIIAGFAKISEISCLVVGQEKGHDTESRLKHNFGMPKPEGYRKIARLFALANKFDLPIVSMIDTSGAYPGIESEERGQAEAIAKCIEASFQIDVPIVSVVIGEGGSGGAVAISAADYVLMLENSIYSVISPEGCAAILWKDEKEATVAADVLKLTAQDLLKFGIIDEIVQENIGGAHRNKATTMENVKQSILKYLNKSILLPAEERKNLRRKKFIEMGAYLIKN